MRGIPSSGLETAVRMVAALAVVLAAGACDDDPSGPGTFEARVTAPADRPAGAAVVEVTGQAIDGFEAAGSSRIFTSTVVSPTEESPEGTYRVVVVTPSGAPLGFRVRMEDVAAGVPAATLISVADTADRRVESLEGFRIRFEPL